MAARIQEASTSLYRRQSLEATVHRACLNCGAPARYLSHRSIQEGWPGCWVPQGDPRADQFIARDAPCPNCGCVVKPQPEELGEIWAREWGAPRSRLARELKGIVVALMILWKHRRDLRPVVWLRSKWRSA